MIRKPGTVNFWVDPQKNPGAFTDGVNYRWVEFQLHGEHCIVISEGKIIRATMNPDTPREVEIFSRPMDLDQKNRHMLTVTWSEDVLTLYVDGQEEYQVQMDDLF